MSQMDAAAGADGVESGPTLIRPADVTAED